MKKLVGVLMIGAAVIFAAGTANAAFSNGDLIMVVDNTSNGNEYAQDLGSFSTLANGNVGAAITTLESAALNSPSSLEVFYFDAVSATQDYVGATAKPVVGSQLKYNGANTLANGVLGDYAGLTPVSGVVNAGQYNGASTYFTSVAGNFGGLFNSATAVGASFASSTTPLNLEIYDAVKSVSVSDTGIDITTTILADGSIQASISGETASPTPIPPSVLLFVPGLLGLVGLKRRISA